MDPAAWGTLLVGVAAVLGGLFTYFGKRGENAITGYSSLTGDLRTELAEKKAELAEKKAELAEKGAALALETAARTAAEAEAERLQRIITRLGGDPS